MFSFNKERYYCIQDVIQFIEVNVIYNFCFYRLVRLNRIASGKWDSFVASQELTTQLTTKFVTNN